MRIHRATTAILTIMAMATALSACDSGAGQKTKGEFESAAGSITGDAKLKNQGKKDEVVGGVKNTVGDMKAAVHDAAK